MKLKSLKKQTEVPKSSQVLDIRSCKLCKPRAATQLRKCHFAKVTHTYRQIHTLNHYITTIRREYCHVYSHVQWEKIKKQTNRTPKCESFTNIYTEHMFFLVLVSTNTFSCTETPHQSHLIETVYVHHHSIVDYCLRNHCTLTCKIKKRTHTIYSRICH